MKILLDTCIVIDALQARKPFDISAQKIFKAAAENKIMASISAKSVTDIYYMVYKQTHNDKQTRQILQKLFALFYVEDTLAIDCINAISSDMTDYEDAVMSETARHENMDYIVTRNIKDYSKSKVPVLSPDEFLKLV